MSNRGIRWLLLIDIKINGKIRLIIPIPLLVLFEIVDDIETLIECIGLCWYKKNKNRDNGFILIQNLKKILNIILQIKYMNPMQIVDLQTKEVSVKICIK